MKTTSESAFRGARRWRLAVPALLLASCQNAQTPQPQPLVSPEPLTSNTEPLSGPLQPQKPSRVLVAKQGPARLSSRSAAGSSATGEADVTLNFADADIREVARTILGQMLKVNYTIDPNVHGTTTIETPTPMRRDQLIPTLTTLLAQNGATMVLQDGVYRILPSTAAVAAANLVGPRGNGAGTEVVTLTYAGARELAKVLAPYIGDSARIAPDASRNALIVSGDAVARRSVIQLIQAFDVDLLAGQSYALFPVSNDDPAKLATELQKALRAEGVDSPMGDLVRIIPMERINGLLVVAARPRYIDDARRLFSVIEQARENTARSWHVYYVQNGQASDVANVLQRAFTPGHVTAQPISSTQQGATAPGLEQTSFSNNNTSTGGISGLTTPNALSGGTNGSSGTSAFGTPGQSAAAPTANAAAGGASASTEPLSSTESDNSAGAQGQASLNSLRILPDQRVNAVLIYSTAEEESVIESMLHKVDILPMQVQIDATIAEVTLNDALQYGTQFYFKGGGLNGELATPAAAATTATNALPALTSTFPGFVLAKTSSAVQFALSALQSVTTVRVLSSPQLLVLNNQQARLEVGDLVPYLSQTSTSTVTSNAPIVNSINYQQTGVILEVTPRVNAGGLVTLDIEQQVSDVASTTSSTINSPTFQQREVKSRVVVEDGQTIGLAGLIRDNTTRGNSGVPYLKDIPILGNLFSDQTNSRQRTELMVLITPHVVDDQRKAFALTQDLRSKLGSAAAVPVQLQRLPPSGSDNPLNDAFRTPRS